MTRGVWVVVLAAVLAACSEPAPATAPPSTTLPSVAPTSASAADALDPRACGGPTPEVVDVVLADLDGAAGDEAVVVADCGDPAQGRLNVVLAAGPGAPAIVGEFRGDDLTLLEGAGTTMAVVVPVRVDGVVDPLLVERVVYALRDGRVQMDDRRQMTAQEYATSFAPDRRPAPTQGERIEQLRSGVALVWPLTCEAFGWGSGFLVGQDLVVTNAHVVEGAVLVRVEVGGRVQEAAVVGVDALADLALLRLPEAVEGHVFDLVGGEVEIGEEVWALGFPLEPWFSATAGVVSGLHRRLVIGESANDDAVITTAEINPGNSGGPLVDGDGGVVGVNSAFVSAAETVGFVIPAARVAGSVDGWRYEPALPPAPVTPGCNTGSYAVASQVVDLRLPPVVYALQQYVEGVNFGEPLAAWDVTELSRTNPAGYEAFRAGVSTSTFDGYVVEAMTPVGDTELDVDVRFVTYQDPEHGPRGEPWTCARWQQRLRMRVGDDGRWRIATSEERAPVVACAG